MTNEERDEMLIRIDASLPKLTRDVEEIHKAVYGNGSPGLLSRMGTVEALVMTLEKSRKEDHAELYRHANRNTERIVALETNSSGWKQYITWLLALGALVVSSVNNMT